MSASTRADGDYAMLTRTAWSGDGTQHVEETVNLGPLRTLRTIVEPAVMIRRRGDPVRVKVVEEYFAPPRWVADQSADALPSRAELSSGVVHVFLFGTPADESCELGRIDAGSKFDAAQVFEWFGYLPPPGTRLELTTRVEGWANVPAILTIV